MCKQNETKNLASLQVNLIQTEGESMPKYFIESMLGMNQVIPIVVVAGTEPLT